MSGYDGVLRPTLTPDRFVYREIQCAGCGVLFRAEYEKEKYHSAQCRLAAQSKRQAAKRRKKRGK